MLKTYIRLCFIRRIYSTNVLYFWLKRTRHEPPWDGLTHPDYGALLYDFVRLSSLTENTAVIILVS